METTKKISLPEVPEGFYWKVGDMPAGYGRMTMYEVVDGVLVPSPDPSVILMQRGTQLELQRTPVKGKVWWSKKERVLRYEERYVEVPHDSIWRAMSLRSEDLTVPSVAEIPSFGIEHSQRLRHDGSVFEVQYRVQLTDEGIAHVAEKIMEVFNRVMEHEAYLEKEEELRDKYYGEYPPKVLGE